jgi:glutaredoxin 3
VRVKKLFTEIKTPFKAIEIDGRPDETEIQQYLGSITGASTVPRVFVAGKCIGGCDGKSNIQTNSEDQCFYDHHN